MNAFNEKYNNTERPALEFINGLFFRYTKNRLGIRMLASYADYTNTTTYNIIGYPMLHAGGYDNKRDIRVGLGIQYSLLKRRNWLYSMFDVYYRNVHSFGVNYGAFAKEYSSVSNGFDCFLGLGLKLKTWKNIYVSPELGYYSSTEFVNRHTTLKDVFHLNGEPVQYNDSYSETNINPIFKLHVTAKF
jgi:hypothetical protein